MNGRFVSQYDCSALGVSSHTDVYFQEYKVRLSPLMPLGRKNILKLWFTGKGFDESVEHR